MFSLVPFCGLSVQAQAPAAAPPVAIPALDPAVSYVGRILEEGETVHLSFPGTEIRVRFRGPELRLRGVVTSGAAWFNRSVDGLPQPRLDLEAGPFAVAVAEGLDPEVVHEVRLVRRNEEWQGTIRLDAFELTAGGEFRPAPPERERGILCLGDSITCGQGTEFVPPYAPPGNSTANAELAFGWVLAKTFGADVHLVSYGGRGVIRDWQGNRDTGTAIEIFERAHSGRATPRWNHDRYTPDLITIAFGTNDYNQGMVDRSDFVQAYRALVTRIHRVHPEARILLLSSPMLPGYAPEKARDLEAALRQIEASFQAEGADHVRVYAFGDFSGTAWDSHPTGAQHAAMAAELVPLVREWLDWNPVESAATSAP